MNGKIGVEKTFRSCRCFPFLPLFLLLSILLFPASSSAQIKVLANAAPSGTVPGSISYQGRLLQNGFPVTGTEIMTFYLYDAPTGGNILWQSAPQQIAVSQGVFGTSLNISTSALSGTVQKYIETDIGATPLLPRQALLSVPYALIARSIEGDLTIASVTVTGTLTSTGTLAVSTLTATSGMNGINVTTNVFVLSGSLGIGTASPASRLDVEGSSNAFQVNGSTFVVTGGNVGIGTTNPATKLYMSSGILTMDGTNAEIEVGGGAHLNFTGISANNGDQLEAVDSSQNQVVQIGASGGVGVISGSYFGAGPYPDIAIKTSGIDRLHVTSGGNVGIGVASPAQSLDIAGTGGGFAGIHINSAVPGSTSMTLYNNAGALTWNGAVLAAGSSVSGTPGDIPEFVTSSSLGNSIVSVGASSVTVSGSLVAASTLTVQGNAFSVGGSTLVVAGGNVGIGTTGPSAPLHVRGNVAAASSANSLATSASLAAARIQGPSDGSDSIFMGEQSSGGGFPYIQSANGPGSGALSLAIQPYGGNVGIGTVNPLATLSIVNGGTGAVFLSSNTLGGWYGGLDSTGGYIQTNGTLPFSLWSGTTRAMTVTNAGSVGIGTTNPGQKLQVNQDTTWAASGTEGQVSIRGTSNANNQLELGVDTTGNYGFIAAALLGTGWKNLALQPSGGNVGIGTTAPHFPLEVVGGAVGSNLIVGPYTNLNDTTGVANTLQFGNYTASGFVTNGKADSYVYKAISTTGSVFPFTPGNSGSLVFQLRNDINAGSFVFAAGSTPSTVMAINSNGNVGIGTTGPQYTLDVNGAIRSTATLIVSDIRFKDKVAEMSAIEDPIAKLLKLRGVYFHWNKTYKKLHPGADSSRQIGVVAQEVRKEYPELVSEGPDGYLAVDYAKLSAVLIEAVKEEQKEIVELKKELRESRARSP